MKKNRVQTVYGYIAPRGSLGRLSLIALPELIVFKPSLAELTVSDRGYRSLAT